MDAKAEETRVFNRWRLVLWILPIVFILLTSVFQNRESKAARDQMDRAASQLAELDNQINAIRNELDPTLLSLTDEMIEGLKTAAQETIARSGEVLIGEQRELFVAFVEDQLAIQDKALRDWQDRIQKHQTRSASDGDPAGPEEE